MSETTEPTPALHTLIEARKALQQHDLLSARRMAAEAARLDPNLEEAWLILGAAASPGASEAYIRRALAINPTSKRALKGLEWAAARRKTWEAGATGPIQHSAAATQKIATNRYEVTAANTPVLQRTTALPRVLPKKSPTRPWLTVLIMGILTLTLFASGLGAVYLTRFRAAVPLPSQPKLVFTVAVTPPAEDEPQAAAVLATVTSLPPVNPTATQLPTAEPTSKPTSLPTPELAPTDTPVPAAESASLIPTVQVIPITGSEGQFLPAVVDPGSQPAGDVSGRRIEVDLANQTVYAYEGDQLVNSFVVSTGTWEHPTVTGTYQVYVKYTYADMSGPGYYLPDVPYVMYFYRGYGLHGTYWHNNFGSPMSHGCVNLRTDDAAWLFGWASVGTPVTIY